MKLRNKKTGKIYTARSMWFNESIDDLEKTHWKTLKEFCEDWEDCTPTEPMIKDPKIRKAVRVWDDANGDTKLYYNRPTVEICINDNAGYVIRSIKFKAEFREANDIESGYYTITEL